MSRKLHNLLYRDVTPCQLGTEGVPQRVNIGTRYTRSLIADLQVPVKIVSPGVPKTVGKDIFASFKNFVGGELSSYTELLEESREEAVNRMTQMAKDLGANAILNVRFSTSSVAAGAAEIYVYGTAVKV